MQRALAFLRSLLRPDLRYWEKRAGRQGRRSVLHRQHSDEEYDRVTEWQKSILLPLLEDRLNGREQVVLDFGCGPGRFTADLARLVGGRVIGVDPIRSLLELAPAAANVEYRQVERNRIPVESGSIDVLWICLVLGVITRARDLTDTVAELRRVLAPNALVFLTENTTPRPPAKHIVYRSVDAYRSLFDFAALEHIHDYEDVGETISVLAGRVR